MRHFLVDDDLSAAEQLAILDLADTLKAEPTGSSFCGAAHRRPPVRQAHVADQDLVQPGIAELGGHPMIIEAAFRSWVAASRSATLRVSLAASRGDRLAHFSQSASRRWRHTPASR